MKRTVFCSLAVGIHPARSLLIFRNSHSPSPCCFPTHHNISSTHSDRIFCDIRIICNGGDHVP